MKVAIFQFSLFGINTYVVSDPSSGECVVVDPGMISEEERQAIDGYISKNNLKLVGVVNTHLHIDHAAGNSYLEKKYAVGTKASKLDLPFGGRMKQQARMFGLPEAFDDVEISEFLEDGDKIKIGNGCLEVIAVPGHSQGSIALYDREDGFVIAGDALFNGSIGRTDLPGGDFDTLIQSIRQKLLSLPDSTVVYPGHGPATTIGDEKRHNPYL